MNYDKLAKQKRIVAKEKKYNIFLLAMGLLFFLPCLWLTFYDLRVLFIGWVPLVLIVFSVKWIAENDRLLKQFSSIAENNAIHKTCEMTLDHPKITFLVKPATGSYKSLSKTFYAITLKDRRKRKYYYFLDECVTMSFSSAQLKRIRAEFWTELHVQCYLNTSIIRTVENDPRYFAKKIWNV